MNPICIFQHIQKKYNDRYADRGRFQKMAGLMCAIVSAEMAIRTVGCLFNASMNRDLLSRNLAGSLFYAICAINPIPYSPALGATVFSLYSIGKNGVKNPYYTTTKIFNLVIDKFSYHIIRPLWDRIVVPCWNQCITPLCTAIRNIFSRVIGAIVSFVSLPSNPAWYGVTLLVVAIAVKKTYDCYKNQKLSA